MTLQKTISSVSYPAGFMSEQTPNYAYGLGKHYGRGFGASRDLSKVWLVCLVAEIYPLFHFKRWTRLLRY